MTRHGGDYWAKQLRLLDPLEVAIDHAKRNLGYISRDEKFHLSEGEQTAFADEFVQFCMANDAFEVLSGVANYSHSAADAEADRFPGFRFRRLRPLAMAVEQFTGAILLKVGDTNARRDLMAKLSSFVDSGESIAMQPLRSQSYTSDAVVGLEMRVVALMDAASVEAQRDSERVRTLVAAVAGRNLVSHRSQIVYDPNVLGAIGESCGDALVHIWQLARAKGWV